MDIETLIYTHYNVLLRYNILRCRVNYNLLQEQLVPIDHYNHNDRYLLIDDDVHYYMPNSVYSLTWFNILKIFLQLDIPLWTIIIISSNPNLSKELLTLIPKTLHDFLPTVIDINTAFTAFSEEMFNRINQIETTELIEDSVDKIDKHAICMMGAARIHRNMLMNYFVEQNLLDKIAVSYRSADES